MVYRSAHEGYALNVSRGLYAHNARTVSHISQFVVSSASETRGVERRCKGVAARAYTEEGEAKSGVSGESGADADGGSEPRVLNMAGL